MNPNNDIDHKKMFSELIKKQMLVLGPDITLAKVRNVPGLKVDEKGEVLSIDGDPQELLQALINQFVELSGMIVKKTMESILTSYPGMMGIAAGQMMGVTPVEKPQITPPQAESVPVAASPQVQNADSVTTPQEPRKEEPHTEPPSMASMQLDSLNSAPETQKKEVQPQSFTADEMADLNKALEDLAKAPLTTETPAQQPQTAS